MLWDILLFDRKKWFKYHFYNDPDQSLEASQKNTYIEQTNNQILHSSSGWTPPSGWDPFLDTYRNSIINEILKELDNPTISKKKNLSHKNFKP